MSYLPTIGLEVHVQLKTRSKLFCACATAFGAPPNTQVCPVCLGYPGVLPAVNEEAVRLTVLAGLMLGSRISAYSKFDRKNYYYPDMPKNYQISQYDKPLCVGGAVDIEVNDKPRKIGITRIHLEEDVGKNMHFATFSGIDFNRAGIPLMEIVTEPDMVSADEALAFLLGLKQIMLYAGVSDCNLEEGNLRVDINCSIRPSGTSRLGTKTEIKNMNTFKGVFNALRHEIQRQIEVVSSGGTIRQETLRWDPEAEVTTAMRSKEYAHDYRYFPEPDLMPIALAPETIQTWARALAELPHHRRERFEREYGLPAYDARVLVGDKSVADYYEAVVRQGANPKAASNWVMTEMLRLLSEREQDIRETRITPQALAALINLVESKTINMPTAKELFAALFESGGDPAAIVAEKGLGQVSDTGLIEAAVDEAIKANPRSVEDYRRGKKAALQFLVGQVMRQSRGKANPSMVQQSLERKLSLS
jgi:aspartyl-tRNA(Asn)/glutamyl-tRNA(Gln) amidotransferase subunit B